MRKLTPALGISPVAFAYLNKLSKASLVLFLSIFSIINLTAQCTGQPGTISGYTYEELNNDGLKDAGETTVGNIMITIYDLDNNIVDQSISDNNGYYAFTGLENNASYRLEFQTSIGYLEAFAGSGNNSSVQFVAVPSCDNNFGLLDPTAKCGTNPEILVTCFVQGSTTINGPIETIVGLEHGFKSDSDVSIYATHAETGAVWGLDYSTSQSTIYSSAFVKQYAGLTSHGPGAIFATSISGTPATTLFVDLTDLGLDVGTLNTTNMDHCAYGDNVGRVGLGGMILSDDESQLYVVNISNNTLVAMPTSNPTASNTTVYNIPDPGCTDGDTRAFALDSQAGKLYVGVTCTAETSQNAANSAIHVYEFDPVTTDFTLIFSTNYIKGFWYDTPTNSEDVMHWLTDIDFTDEGHMLLGIADRVGHKYCNSGSGRLDTQNPDLLVAYLDNNGVWTLESNGQAGAYSGSGVGNNQGPGGGEFFGHEYWPSGPAYHPETSLGSIYVLDGSGQVVSANYDPSYSSYSGGLHRYRTTDGKKVNFKELYVSTYQNQFGKATGFGNITSICPPQEIEIGNYVWFDDNKNGIQDAGEATANGITLNLYDGNCQLVGTTSTNNFGNYYFNSSNVDLDGDGVFDALNANDTYYVQLDESYNGANNTYTIGSDNYELCSQNIGSGAHADMNDSDANLISNVCNQLDNSYAITTSGLIGGGNHQFDLGLCREEVVSTFMDLALMKTLVTNEFVSFGEIVTFKVSVMNQGTATAYKIKVADYVPSGFTFDAADNQGWSLNNNQAYAIIDELEPGGTSELYINLNVSESGTDYINYSEIASFEDENGLAGEDIDSTPDNDQTNDIGGEVNTATDDEIMDSGVLDEDDHDPAMTYMFDLALRKVLRNANKTYLPGDEVVFDITVFNQGDITATKIQITDYLPTELVFASSDNPGWEFDGNGNVFFPLTTDLDAGDSKTVSINLRIRPDATTTTIVNRSEISHGEALGFPGAQDFDSTPDNDASNDMGGELYTTTDNEIADHGITDEDDADPAVINAGIFDLALIKTTEVEYLRPGQEVDYKITVVNQGSIAANNIKIVDYLPALTTVIDNNWTVIQNSPTEIAERTLTLTDPLGPGESVDAYITIKIDEAAEAAVYVNKAEISGAEDANGIDRSNDDIDSSPDTDPINDLGGIPNSPSDNVVNAPPGTDEDDHDPESLVLVSSEIAIPCTCRNNATNGSDGQFEDVITVTAASGETWYVQNTIGLYDITSVAGALLAINVGPMGLTLMENPLGNGMSLYVMSGVHVDGDGYSIMLTNGNGIFETLNNPGCSYAPALIEGPVAACAGSIVSFETPDVPGATYEWTLDGVVIGTTNPIDITAGGAPGDQVVGLSITAPGACNAPSTQTLSVGNVSGAIACLKDINLSMNGDCEVVVTPQMVMVSAPIAGGAYGVMLTDAAGNTIPNATLTRDHLYQNIMVKVIESCSGNSCWGNIWAEDKLGPEIFCEDITISCIDMLQYAGPLAADNCDTYVEVTQTGESITPLECDDDFVKIITRTYMAEDDQGNQSTECTQTISVERIDVLEIEPLEDFLISATTNLSCGEYLLNADGNPDVSVTGVPTIDGVPLYPDFNFYCNVSVGFSDYTFPVNNCVQRVVRTWNIVEWHCSTSEITPIVQTIEIQDDTAPTITCPSDITVTTNGHSCEGIVVLEVPTTMEACSPNNVTIDVAYPGGFIADFQGGAIALPFGIHTVTYTAYDACYQSSSCDITVTVEDNTPPVAICKQNLVASLNANGEAIVYAGAFDSGSYDDCHIGTMEVMRMNDPSACGSAGDFAPEVIFCCADAGSTVQVVFRIYDMAGNMNQCMVNVAVQDKFAPVIECPANVTIDCGDDISDLSIFGDAVATDACNMSMNNTFDLGGLDQCGVGTIFRFFTATDGNGSDVCIQSITVENPSPFNGAITWPQDYETQLSCTGDNLDPSNLPAANAYPTFTEDACDMVAATFMDETFLIDPIDNSCFKILRRWNVIDWCQYDGTVGIWSYTQVLKVKNFVDPMITSGCADISVCTYDPLCADGFVELIFTATDDCTPDALLEWQYEIDLFNDGSVNMQNSGTGGTINASTEYPIGTHSILWFVEDRCGNTVSCTQNFTVVNCKAPTAYCINGLAVALEPADTNGDNIPDVEIATICVEHIDAGSNHSCGTPIDLSFSADVNDDCITFDCDDLGVQMIQLWVTDANGGTSFCETFVDVQDNNNVTICAEFDICVSVPPVVNAVTCGGNYSPTVIGGEPTVATDCACQNYTTSFSDAVIAYPNPDCSIVTRTWTVTFNCGGVQTPYDYVQIINVDNANAPTISCPADITVSEGGNCTGVVTINNPVVTSLCNSGVVITNNSFFGNSTTDASGSYPIGTTPVTFTATDACNNTTSCTINVTVEDNTAPICNVMDITINASAGSATTIDFSDLDAGSTDNCSSIVSSTLSQSSFDCNDIGANSVTVNLTDTYGNMSSCTAVVTVLDVSAPICAAQDITIQLDAMGNASITAGQIDNGSSVGCTGTISLSVAPSNFNCSNIGANNVTLTVLSSTGASTTCTATVTVEDVTDPIFTFCPADVTILCDQLPSDLSLFGEPTATDECDLNLNLVSNVVMNLNTCNIGTIVRNFVVNDDSGNTAQCNQVITVENMGMPVTMSDIVVQPDTIFLADCASTDPAIIGGAPVINGGMTTCMLISVDFMDSAISSTCMDTVDRVWTVIDSCQLNGDGVTGIFNFNQALVINDISGPVVTIPDTIMVDCENQPSSVIATVTDCDPNVTVVNDFNSGGADASDDYPIGNTTVTFTATDVCGNITVEDVVVSVFDTIPPEIDCKKFFPIVVSSTAPVTIVPTDFVCGYMDNCTDSLGATILFMDFWEEGDPFGTQTTFSSFDVDCDDVGIPTQVFIAVLDEAGNFTPCISLFTLLDTNMVCPITLAGVNGGIQTENDENIANATVRLENSGMADFVTNTDGNYAFENMTPGGSYIVRPTKNDDHTNGVSTLDMIHIQRHILGTTPLSSPYQHIAADVNKSGNISGIDLIELRKLILGVYPEFPNNDSWRMIDKGYQFVDPTNPLQENFDESYAIENLNSIMNIDFVGVKIGDVNGSATANISDVNIVSRDANPLQLFYDNQDLMTNQETRVDLKATYVEGLKGFQIAIAHNGLEVIDITSPQMTLTALNINKNVNGITYLSWDGNQDLDTDRAFLQISVKALVQVSLSKALSISSEMFISEAYFGNDLEIGNVELNAGAVEEIPFSVSQNRPNPWNNTTTISVTVGQKEEAKLVIQDVLGATVLTKDLALDLGKNEVIIDKESLSGSGLYFYTIISGDQMITKQMIKL